MNWNHLKPQVEAHLQEAGLTGTPAAKLIITFERRRNTCLNMINWPRCGSWEAMTESKAYMQASDALDQLNSLGDFEPEEAPYWKQWVAYCDAAGIGPTANLGDHLC